MGNLMRKYLLASLLAFGFVASAQAAATKFTDVNCRNLTVTGTLTSGGCTCTNISTTTLTANDLVANFGVATSTITVSTMTVSGAQGLRTAQGHITAASTVPAAAGILAHDSSWILYISTGTGAGAWVKVGGQ